jgi:hypothetical protein
MMRSVIWAGGELGLQYQPLPLDLSRRAQLAQQVLQEVVRVPAQRIYDLPVVADNGDLPLEEDVRLGDVEPLVLLDGLGKLLLGSTQ